MKKQFEIGGEFSEVGISSPGAGSNFGGFAAQFIPEALGGAQF